MTFTTAGLAILVEVLNPELGGDDAVFGSGGNDLILGGYGTDTVYGGAGNDFILGDNGYIQFAVSAGPLFAGGRASGNRLIAGSASAAVAASFPNWFSPAAIRLVTISSPTLGGSDNLNGDEGNDLIIGARATTQSMGVGTTT